MGRTDFSADFGLFGIFEPDSAKTVAASSDENKNSLTLLKGQSVLKENQNRLINRYTISVQSISPRTSGPPDSERDKRKKIS